jgi:hypothetical protein
MNCLDDRFNLIAGFQVRIQTDTAVRTEVFSAGVVASNYTGDLISSLYMDLTFALTMFIAPYFMRSSFTVGCMSRFQMVFPP